MASKTQSVETCDTNVYHEDISETLHWHLTQLQPLLRDNVVQIGCRLQSRGHRIWNKLHKCPAICCLPPYHTVFVKGPDAEVLVDAVSFFLLSLSLLNYAVCCFFSLSLICMSTFRNNLGLFRKARLLNHVKLRVSCMLKCGKP